MTRLTKPLLNAIEAALSAALAGDGFDGGDFDGDDPRHFERALQWVREQQERRLRCAGHSENHLPKGNAQ